MSVVAPVVEQDLPSLASLHFVRKVKGHTPQLMSLAGGGFSPATTGGEPLALELQIASSADTKIDYFGFRNSAFPSFLIDRFVGQEWEEIPMGFCGSGTGFGRFSIEPQGTQLVYAPVPSGDAPIRITICIEESRDGGRSEDVTVEWSP